MASTPPLPERNADTSASPRRRPDRGSPPSTPRWVIVFGVIALTLVVLVVVLHLSGGGFGGMMNHFGHQP